MAYMEVVGGIKAEIKNEAEEVVEIGLNDIISKNESDSEDPFDVSDDDGDNENFEYVQNEISGQASGSQFNLSNGSEVHNKDREEGDLIQINNEKEDHRKGGKHFKITSNLNIDETLVLNNTASPDLLDDVNKQELKRRKVNRKRVEEGKDAGNSVTNQVGLSETYLTNKGIPISEDIRKDNVTEVPISFVSPTEYNVEALNKFICNHCKFLTSKRIYILKHIRYQHRDSMKMCPYCPYETTYPIKSHIMAKHRAEYELEFFRCAQCSYKSKFKAKLAEHMNTHLHPSQMVDHMNKRGPSPKIVSPTEYTVEAFNKFICNHCKFLTSKRKYIWKHIRYQHRDRMKMYPYCPYETKYSINNHIIAEHQAEDELELFGCGQCSYKSKSKATLAIHENAHEHRSQMMVHIKNISPTEYTVEASNRFICNHCQFFTSKRIYILKHIRYKHRDGTKIYQCPYCPHKAKLIASVEKHIICKHKAEDELEWFGCAHCSYKSKFKTGLVNHMNRRHLHSSLRMKKCALCPKIFKDNTDLRAHTLGVHKGHRRTKLKCPECDFECALRTSLRHHRDAYHTNPEDLETLLCDKCTFKTKLKRTLLRHMKKEHAERLFQCDKCAYQTNTIDRLKLHLIGHQEVKSEADLKYRCDKCDYKTYRLYSLNVHKLNHLKPEEIQFFYCYLCDFKAKRKDNLKTHVLRHFKHGEVTFQCYICDFTTKNRHKLTQHIERHSKGTNDMENEKTEVTKSEEKENKTPRVSTNTDKKKNTGQRKNRKRKAVATTGQAKVKKALRTKKRLRAELDTSTEKSSDEAKSPKDEVMSLVKPLRKSERLRKNLKESPES